MSLTTTPGGGFVATGAAVGYVRLASLKGALTLESKGMKSRAGPLRPKLAAELGLEPRDSYEKFIEAIKAKMAPIAEAVAKENAEAAA